MEVSSSRDAIATCYNHDRFILQLPLQAKAPSCSCGRAICLPRTGSRDRSHSVVLIFSIQTTKVC